MAKVRCPDCGYKERVPGDWERSTIRCTECGYKIPLDADPDEDDLEDRIVRKKEKKRARPNPYVKSVVRFFSRLDLTIKILGGIAIFCFLVSFLHPACYFFPIIYGGLLIIGGALLFMVIVYNDNPLEALLCWLVPFYSLYYLITHFDDTKRVIFLQLFGIVVMFSFACAIPFHMVVFAVFGKLRGDAPPDNNPPMVNNDDGRPRGRDRDGQPGRDRDGQPNVDGNRDRDQINNDRKKDGIKKDGKIDPPKVEAPVVTGDREIDQALADLAGSDGKKHKAATLFLSAMEQPNKHRAVVARKLGELVQAPEEWRHEPILSIMKTWATSEEVPILIKFLEHNSINTRNKALDVLGPLKDERAVVPVVRCFIVFQTTYHGEQALKAMGPIAEKEVLALLSQPDEKQWIPAIRVLEHIGTQVSIPTLQNAARRFDLKGVSEAAIVAINKRTKK